MLRPEASLPWAFLLWTGTVFGVSAARAEPVDYARQIKPLLTARCGSCHGALKQEAELRLDASSLILKGGHSGATVVPGKSTESHLIHAVVGAEGFTRMPLDGTPLTEAEIGLLRAWVDQGAIAPDEPIPASPREHWSFQPPVRPAVPSLEDVPPFSIRNPIDAFVAAEQRSHGLTPLGPAPPQVILRRLYLDLTGLPPPVEQLRSYLADPSDAAYQQIVDELLASPRYGERWGRHWMDVWRYSDWAGYQQEIRDSQRHIWRWRDWIIESLNADKGYDRMILEMLAGDELEPTNPDVLRATGYVARNWFKYNRHVWIDNIVEHTGKAFLGLTFNCARCHDHRYDPIAQADYYRLRAFFEPHQVRTDRVPGQADLLQDGLPRIYDADAAAPTYLFARGDDTQPDKDHPLAPGLPEIFAADLKIEPVSLPTEAYYPGIREFVRKETHAAAVAEVEKRRKERNDADAALASAQSEVDKLAAPQAANNQAAGGTAAALSSDASPAKLAAAQGKLADAVASSAELELAAGAADANLLAIDARLAADQARFAAPPDSHAEALALSAARAERQAAIWAIEQELWSAERNLDATRRASQPDDASVGAQLKVRIKVVRKEHGDAAALAKALSEAEAKVEAIRKRLAEAQAAAKQSSPDYTPIDTIYPVQSTGRRLALARWIADESNPLTARVAVNHIWMRHFGEPLVTTVFDFGIRGQPPANHALVNWLSVELMERGWSMKALHRLIVTSAAYRRASSATSAGESSWVSENRAIDPDNRYLWRMNPRRMEAETVRDSVLAASGAIDLAAGGPDLDHEQGLTSRRRSVYFRHASEKQMMFLRVFDTASVTECYRRSESIVPQQTLALANSPLAIEQARRAAAQLAGGDLANVDSGVFVKQAFELVLSRQPSEAEHVECLIFLEEQAAALASAAPQDQAEAKEQPVAPSADPRQRARESLLLVLLNHHDFVTIR